jgi:hypothetical protein
MDEKFKRLLIYYIASGVILAICLSGAFVSNEYKKGLVNTLRQFDTLKVNVAKIKESSKEINQKLSYMKSIMPLNINPDSIESKILSAIDDLPSHMKGAEVAVSNIDKKETEIVVPVTMNGKIIDFSSFINFIGYLKSSEAPLFSVETISLQKVGAEQGASVSYEIKGVFRIPLITLAEAS